MTVPSATSSNVSLGGNWAARLAGKAVLVVGDVMLDIFVHGDANRLSPEAPVPVLRVNQEMRMLGGAGNVVSNLHGLGVKSYLFCVCGDDEQKAQLVGMAVERGADIDGVLSDASRPTSVKSRFVANGQQLLRSDFEKTHPLSPDLEAALIAGVEKTLPFAGAVVLSDYGKGCLTPRVIEAVIAAAAKARCPVLVDPKGQDYSRYHGATVVTPNRNELAEAAGADKLKTDEEVVAAARAVLQKSGIAHMVATRSEDGMSLVATKEDSPPVHLRAQAREVFDVSGAGDTVIAVLAAALAGDYTLEEAAMLANKAGGIVVGKAGTAPIMVEELVDATPGQDERKSGIEQQFDPHIVRGWDDARAQIAAWQAQGLKVGFTSGCFDIVHFGHVTYINQTRALCDRLVIGLNRDVSVKILKGPTRPVHDEVARATVIGALGAVDMVVFFGAQTAEEDNTPRAVLGALRPDLFVKGGDYTVASLPEAVTVIDYGGEVKILPLQDGYSTTAAIKKLAG